VEFGGITAVLIAQPIEYIAPTVTQVNISHHAPVPGDPVLTFSVIWEYHATAIAES
jgi:hypothetical protein